MSRTFMGFGVSTVIMGSWSVLWDTKYRVGVAVSRTFMGFGVSTVIMGSWSVLWDTKYSVGGTSV